MNMGLYDCDYFVVTQQEETEKENIDKKCRLGSALVKATCFRAYPKAIRHGKSLFPNNYLDVVDLQSTDELKRLNDGFMNVLDNKSITELDLKREIQNNKAYHIPASLLCEYSFGHHGAYLFKEFKLGTSFAADYILVGDSSDGHQFVFIECENPYGRITLNDGNFGETIQKGIRQINDWKHFLSSNYATITEEFKKYTNKQLPDEFYKYDATRMNYIVIAGRRSDFNEKTYRLARQSEHDSGISIKHYDNLCDCSISVIGKATY